MSYIFALTSTPALGYGCAAGIAACLTALGALRWRLLLTAAQAARKASETDDAVSTGPLPRVSIIVPVRNDKTGLEANLPRLLTQRYEGTYEVIVADEGSDDESLLVVERLQQTYSHLRATAVPPTSRNITPRKLAVTLGVRAARSEWVIVLSPDSMPPSDDWLNRMARHFTDDADYVSTYVSTDGECTSAVHRTAYERTMRQALRYAYWLGGCITGSEPTGVAYRKSWFLDASGYADSLCLPFGEDAILTSLHAAPERSVLLLDAEVKLTEQLPSTRVNASQRVERQETQRHLSPSARRHLARQRWATSFSQLSILLIIVYTALRTTGDLTQGTYAMQMLPYDAIIGLLTALGLAIALILLRRLTDALSEPHMGLSLIAQALLAPWRHLRVSLQRYAHRDDFVRDWGRGL